MEMLRNGKKVLIFAAHPDDAEISMGGTIRRLVVEGKDVTVVNFTTSEADQKRRERRQRASIQSADILGHELIWAEDGKYDQVEDIPEYKCVGIVDDILKNYSPDYVFTHDLSDSHVDHIRLARAVVASSRRWSGNLLSFGPSEMMTQMFREFVPNFYVNIDGYVDEKNLAIDCYNYGSSFFKSLDIPAIERACYFNGLQARCEAAEAFRVQRYLW